MVKPSPGTSHLTIDTVPTYLSTTLLFSPEARWTRHWFSLVPYLHIHCATSYCLIILHPIVSYHHLAHRNCFPPQVIVIFPCLFPENTTTLLRRRSERVIMASTFFSRPPTRIDKVEVSSLAACPASRSQYLARRFCRSRPQVED